MTPTALPTWTTACVDWERRIMAGESLIVSPPLFPDEAEAALDVFKSLIMVDAIGSPTMGETCEPWVFEFVASIFGALDMSTGRRLISEFFVLISKKNGKSTIAAGIMLTALIRNWRNSAELLILAPTIEAASNSFKPAADMIRADSDLSQLFQIQEHTRTITHRRTKATLKVVAADSGTVVGKKAGFILIDELWEFGSKNGADAMLREATGGIISRPEGFVISITTQSDAPPAGVFRDKLSYFRKVRDGIITDPKSLGILYEFPKAMIESKAYLDPANFHITNPNLGRSVSAEWLEDELRKEEEKGEGTRRTFLAKHLNIEIDNTLREARWAGAEFWPMRGDPSVTLDSVIERSEVITIGIDGGGLDDLFGLTVLGREKGNPQRWLAWTHAWVHVGVLTRRKAIAAHLRDFERDGDLTIVDDRLDDISHIVAIVERVKSTGLLGVVGVDPAGLGEFVDSMASIGVTQESKLLVGIPQGFGLMNAIKTAERKLAAGTLSHSGSPLMNWAVSNLMIEPTATAIRATKQNAGDAKVDPAMSMFDAVLAMSMNPEPVSVRSVYETRGLVLV